MFGQTLKRIRLEQGLTLEALAEKYNKVYKSGISKGTLSKYENGKQEPMLTVIKNLSDILNVSADYLLENDNQSHTDITFDDFTYAMYGESKDLSEDDKSALLDMAKRLNNRINKDK